MKILQARKKFSEGNEKKEYRNSNIYVVCKIYIHDVCQMLNLIIRICLILQISLPDRENNKEIHRKPCHS